MNDEHDLRFDGCWATNIEETYRHLKQVYENRITPLGLTILEWYVLRALYEKDGISASQLAACVCRHPASMTALFARMEEKNLLRREVDITDRRSVRIFLTDQGRAFQPQVEAVAVQIDHLLTNLITSEQMETFFYVLGVLQTMPLPEKK